MTTAPFEPERFEDAVPYYLKHRVRYSDQLIERLAIEASLSPSARVMDLGCGPGFIANAIAPFAHQVIGIDPNESMLAAAREEASSAGVSNVTYKLGSSFDLAFIDGPFQLVTMGRSFHWMDRAATLKVLDGLVAKHGLVALLWDRKPEAPENAWWETFKKICRAFEPEGDVWKEHRDNDWEPHVSLLMRSAFSDVTHIGRYAHLSWTVDDLIGLALSHSGTTSRRLGNQQDAFKRAIREALEPLANGGRLTGLVEHAATLARRPG